MSIQSATIVEYVLGNEGVSPAEMAAHFGVSMRTVRDHIRRANDSMDPSAGIRFSRSRNGYVCEIHDEDVFRHWVSRARSMAQADPAVTTTNRANYLLNDLLQRHDWITLDELAGILFVSRASISNDLKRIVPTLEKHGLTLEKRPRYGIRVAGSEMARRLCLAGVVVRDITAGNEEPDAFERRLEPLMNSLSCAVDRVLREEEFPINSFAHQNLLVHLGIALMRIQDGKHVPAGSVLPADIAGTREYEVAKKIAAALEADLGHELPSCEVAYIAIHLAGKRVLGAGESPTSERVTISDEALGVVSRMLDAVWQSFRFDFRDDIELRMNLARHIMPLSVRLTYNLHLDNPLLGDIKRRYPLAYSMATDASVVLAEEYGAMPSEAERGYIALAFALALERQKTASPRKRLLVVCASGAGSARLLAYKMEAEFGDQVDSIATCNVMQVTSVDFSKIDYVVTTVPLTCEVPVPVREVTLFLDDGDRRRVRSMLEAADPTGIARFFPCTLFFPHCPVTSREEAIAFACERAAAYAELPENLDELVWKREHAAPTAFGNNVALPHPIEAVSEETFVTVLLMDAPIDWGGQDVQAVFLINVSRNAGADIDTFYRSVASMLNDGAAIQELVRHQDFDRLMAELARKE